MRASPPLIGVTTSEVRAAEDVRPVAEGEPQRREMALGLTYMKAIERVGGIPVVLPPLGPEAIEPLLDRLSGVLLSGGPDLDPKTYGHRADDNLGPTWPDLDFFELAIARGADARGLPILAICRGMQALNVARGGTLHQHLCDRDGIVHRQDEPAEHGTHDVQIMATSVLSTLVGETWAIVNSFHHQAIDRLGEGLRAVAWASDDTVEAVEAEDREFVLGVQWHAECLVGDGEQRALFSAFVQACTARAPVGAVA